MAFWSLLGLQRRQQRQQGQKQIRRCKVQVAGMKVRVAGHCFTITETTKTFEKMLTSAQILFFGSCGSIS